MNAKLLLAVLLLLMIAVSLYFAFMPAKKGMLHAGPGNQLHANTISGTGLHSEFTQRFCLNGASNATAMKIAIDNGIKCFRADITMDPGERSFISNMNGYGADYLGILDYDTVGAHPSQSGCVSGCNWTLSAWNASVANAIAEYPEVHEWEIYNEPLIAMFASGYENGNATHYFNMVRSAYLIIKRMNPNATVVCFGGAQLFPLSTVSAEYAFYRQVWLDGASKYCDAISLHAYGLPFYSLSQYANSGVMLGQIYNYTLGLYENLTSKPVWITEAGTPSNNFTAGLNLSEENQARFLRQDLDLFSSHTFVKRIYWFHLVGSGGGIDYGILNATTLQPKPSWYAFLYFADNSAV